MEKIGTNNLNKLKEKEIEKLMSFGYSREISKQAIGSTIEFYKKQCRGTDEEVLKRITED